mgnify:CR=1 FL=1
MSKCLREIRAGRLGYAILYTQPSIADAPRARAEKSRATTEARQKINLRMSWQQLELLLFSNFGRDDFLLTLTYDQEHLPADRGIAVKRLRRFIPSLRAARRKRGQTLKYVYVTENKHGEGRLHHHMVVNGTGCDLDELRSLWPDMSTFKICARGNLAIWPGISPRRPGTTEKPQVRKLGWPART